MALGYILRKIFVIFGLLVFALATPVSSVYAAQSERKLQNMSKKTTTIKRKVLRKSAAVKQKLAVRAEIIPLKPSFGQIAGLHASHDSLALKSSVALVVDQETNEVLFSKNDQEG